MEKSLPKTIKSSKDGGRQTLYLRSVLAMKKVQTGKVPGYDDIPAELIKETGKEELEKKE